MKPDEVMADGHHVLETMSQTSETTETSTTVSIGPHGFDSREELLECATILHVTDIDELHRERFRVDRRKLENMLLGDDENIEPANTFFQKIMGFTNTIITWPTKLKIGAKSKKDPYIKVAGRTNDVAKAKEEIMKTLDTRQGCRVTMKVDLSYTDHSHIIGKGGLTIKKVMEETNCHIHFPDSNRTNHQEKSNQVSIAGEMESVEKARARVRNLTPLIFSFELPVMATMQTTFDPTSPYIVKIQEKLNVQVMFRTRPKLHATLVLVKGCEWEVQKVKDATVFLIHHMCKHLASQILVHMAMEISPQHHSVVLGKNNSNLKLIMQRTSTQIMFPDAGDPNIPSLKKSNVIIIGNIDNVYSARQQMIGSLPLVLMFDLPENSAPVLDSTAVTDLMQALDVFINIRSKPKQNNSMSVIIKGVERNANNIYQARRILLNLEDPPIQAAIPTSYHIPNATNQFLANNIIGNSMGLRDNLRSMSPMEQQNPYGSSPHMWNPTAPSIYSTMMPSTYDINHANAQWLLATHQALQANFLNQRHAAQIHQRHSNQTHGDYVSLSSASSSLSSPEDTSPNATIENLPGYDLNSMMSSDRAISDNRVSRKMLNLSAIQHERSPLASFDVEQQKILALKAIQTKPKSSEVRVPTNIWAGFGLSETMPASVGSGEILDPNDLWDDPATPLAYTPPMESDWESGDYHHNVNAGMTSVYLEQTPSNMRDKLLLDVHSDFETMLTNMGLDKYIRIFKSHEVDLVTFRSLTDKDLSELGITAWGAKRKILLLISELNKRTMTFSGSAAPGAERKTTSNTSVTSKGLHF